MIVEEEKSLLTKAWIRVQLACSRLESAKGVTAGDRMIATGIFFLVAFVVLTVLDLVFKPR